jgi:putative transposase
MARRAVKEKSISIRLACEVFGISETCYRYKARLSEENARIARWLWKYNHERPNMALGGIAPKQKLSMAA